MRSILRPIRACPKCNAWKNQVKNGRNPSGSRRKKCMECGRVYTVERKSNRYAGCYILASLWLAHASSYRQIAELLDVTPQTVINWVRKNEKGFHIRIQDLDDLYRILPQWREYINRWDYYEEGLYWFPFLKESHQFAIRHQSSRKKVPRFHDLLRLIE